MTTAPDGTVTILVTQRVLPGKEAELEGILRTSRERTLADDEGCLRYEWYRSSEPQTYMLFERWTSQAAVEAHLATPRMKAMFESRQAIAPEKFSYAYLVELGQTA